MSTDTVPLPSIAAAEAMIAEARMIVRDRYAAQALAAGHHVLIVDTGGPAEGYDGVVLWELKHPDSCPTMVCPAALELLLRPLDLRLPDAEGAYRLEFEDDCLNPPYARCVELPDLP